MELSNLKKKYKNCLGPSSISVALSENNCQRNIWLQYRHKADINDSIFLEKYQLKHQAGPHFSAGGSVAQISMIS